MKLHETINWYFKARRLVEPMAHAALMFFISEVGELAEAYIVRANRGLPAGMMNILLDMQYLGKRADQWVSGQASDCPSGQAGWVRNNGRAHAPNVESEVADCLMMLERFGSQLRIDPEKALIAKMREKGFDPEIPPSIPPSEKAQMEGSKNGYELFDGGYRNVV